MARYVRFHFFIISWVSRLCLFWNVPDECFRCSRIMHTSAMTYGSRTLLSLLVGNNAVRHEYVELATEFRSASTFELLFA